MDDVVNVSGHRMSTAEIEAALIEHGNYIFLSNTSLCYMSNFLLLNANSIFLQNNIETVAEAAVVGVQDDLTGQAVNAFVALKHNKTQNQQPSGTAPATHGEKENGEEATSRALILQVRKSIGPFAAPRHVYIVPDLPKTRSGKIMRRILRKIVAGEEGDMGDVSTVSIFSHALGALSASGKRV